MSETTLPVKLAGQVKGNLVVVSLDSQIQKKCRDLVEEVIEVNSSEKLQGIQFSSKIQFVAVDLDFFHEDELLERFIGELKIQNIRFILIASTGSQTPLIIRKLKPDAYLLKPLRRKDLQIVLQLIREEMGIFGKTLTSENPRGFTPTEQLVLRLIAENKTTRTIAKTLHVSESTIKNHRHNVAKKLKLSGGTHSLKSWVFQNLQSLF